MADTEESAKKNLKRKNSSTTILDYGYLPPQERGLEKAILGAILIENEALHKVIGILTSESFYVDAHQRIYKAILELYDEANPIDLLTVTHQLKVNNDLDACGGPFYVAQLTSGIGSSAHIHYHAQIVQEKRMLRLIIASCTEVVKDAYGNGAMIDECLAKLESGVEEVQAMFSRGASHNAYSATQEALLDINNRDNGTSNSQIYTGWTEYDNLLMLDACKLIIVASSQKIGKTAFIISQVRRIARRNKNIAIKWYSFEMTASANIRRIVMEDCHLTENQLLSRKYKLTAEEKKRIKASMDDIAKWDMDIVDRRMSISELERDYKLFCKKRKGKLCICVVDNHGFLASKTEDDDIASKAYSYLRDQTNSLIFVIHHLATKGNPFFNIESGYEPNKDLVRGSTRILDYCNALILLHRPNFYADLMARLKLECTPNELEAISKLFIGIVPINRDGDIGMFRLQHDIARNTFNEFPKLETKNDTQF